MRDGFIPKHGGYEKLLLRDTSAAASRVAARCGEVLVDGSSWSDRHDADEASRPVELADDASTQKQ
jgi:hypothetical protein